MPAPLPVPLRQRIHTLLQRDFAPTAIARQLHLCPRTVRHLCQTLRQRGVEALRPAPAQAAAATPTPAIQQALLLHEEHPSWGAPYLLIQLRQLQPDLPDLPSARTLQRWMRRLQQPPGPPGRKPDSTTPRAQRPHEVWQMDAVEQLRLDSGQQVSWLRWVDEYTGAVLGTAVFPPRHLRSGPSLGRATGLAPAIWGLGPADLFAGGQRRPVGQLERPADRVRFVGGGAGRGLALE